MFPHMYTRIYYGTSETVLIREVFLYQRLICTEEYTIGTPETVLISEEESSFKRDSTVHDRVSVWLGLALGYSI